MKTHSRLRALHLGVNPHRIALRSADANSTRSLHRRSLARLAGAALASLLIVPVVQAADLPVKDGLISWLKADAINTSDATQVRTSGSDVYVRIWQDQSPGTNPHSATNTVDADQPLYVPGALNGLPVLRFTQDNDDTGDRLYLGDLGKYSLYAGSIFVVATPNNDGRYNLFGNRGGGSDERWVADTWNESQPGSWRTARVAFPRSSWPTTDTHVFVLESSPAIFRIAIDGSEIGARTPDFHSGTGSDWTIGNRSTDGQQFNGDIAELILYNHVLSAEEANQVGYYLASKYGVATTYVDAPAPQQAKIYEFAFPSGPCVINDLNITMAYPFGTDVRSLAPTFTLSAGATCDRVSGAPLNFVTPQLFTVVSSDNATTNIYTVTVTVRPPAISYDFNSGLQGWTQFYPPTSSSSVLWQGGALGSGYDLDDPYSRMGRSPVFILHGLDDLTFQLRGGQSPQAAPLDPSAIPEQAINGGGFAGVALRDVDSNTYVLYARRNGDENAWQTGRFTTGDLAPHVGKRCTLDYLDYNSGGWGWTYMDNVSIPGYGTQVLLESADTTISLGKAGSNATAVLKIPEGVNQTVAVTVYVTNLSPSLVTIDGSAQPVLTYTFDAGGPNTKTLTVGGLAVGTATIIAHNADLDDATLTFNVVPALLGRWLAGAADLTDVSGFQPAGTHNGTAVGTTANLKFSADLPPGGTGQSLDLRTGDVGVMIGNTATGDAGYVNTFDSLIRGKFTVAFWAKGFPGTWNPWISKRGEDGIGWQFRRFSGDTYACMTVRGIDNEDGSGGTINVNDTAWHYFVGTWDQATGKRSVYVDGVLSHTVNNTLSQTMAMAAAKHLALGARENSGTGYGNYFAGLLYDVRIFSYALSQAEARALMPAAVRLTGRSAVKVGGTASLAVSIPFGANATAPVTVDLANGTPARLTIGGSSAAVVSVVFEAGATNSQTVTLAGVSAGMDSLSASAAGMASASLNVEVYAAGEPGLIGRWLAGAPHLADVSGFTAGAHDGSYVGAPGTVNFTNDLPFGGSGSALDLRGTPNFGVRINNSRSSDAGYLPTFDADISTKFTVAFWAKGFPGEWNPWVAKYGENGQGWQLRRFGGNSYACLTVRGQSSDDGDGSKINVNDANWHHYVGVWDSEAGLRSLYVDGVLSHSLAATYPMTQSPTAHLVLGARGDTSDNFGNWFKGLLYDVRLYNIGLSADEAFNLMGGLLVTPQSYSLVTPSANDHFVTITVPPGLVAAGNVIINVVSDKPGVAVPEGAINGTLTITLPQGGGNSATFAVQAVGAGTAHFTYVSAQVPSASVTTISVQQPNIGGLVAYWNFDDQTLAETAGFQPAGVHDGEAVGSVAFVPGRLGGYAADLRAASTAIRIKNTVITDANYRSTFDAFMFNSPNGFTWTAWVKGMPVGDWASWIAKDGEAAGFAVRKAYSGMVAFTLRNSDGDDDPTDPNGVITDAIWHHVAAVYDPVNSQRRLYIDGVERVNIADGNLTATASSMPLMFGARDLSGDPRFARVIVDEIRAYDRTLTPAEITGQVGDPMISIIPDQFEMNLGDKDLAATLTVPTSMLATGAVNVTIVSANPAVAIAAGATAGSLTLSFPMGGPNTATINVHATGVGTTTLSGTSPSGIINGSIQVTVLPSTTLLGRWITGTPDLADKSGHTPPGTHDGRAVGANAGSLSFSDDVPAGFSGQSLDLMAGSVGVTIDNTCFHDGANYLTTFDTEIATNFSVAFWAKGVPGEWSAWVTKNGEDKGWQVRRWAANNYPCFTIRGLDNEDGTGSGVNINNNNWHHYVGTWNKATGIRALYVDGALSHINQNDPSQNMSLAQGARLMFGGRMTEGGGYGDRWTACYLYDIRIYKNSLSTSRVQALLVPTVDLPPLTIQPAANQEVRLAWPTSYTGFVLEEAPTVDGVWAASALNVKVEGNENAVYAPVAASKQFFRLIKQ